MPTKTNTKRVRTTFPHIASAISRPELVSQMPAQKFVPLAGALVYALTIFLGAFLLFQVQLILGKFVLPRFGGGPSVWSTSLLTFQILLLAGYGYAAVLTHRFRAKTQSEIHVVLLLASAVLMALAIWKWSVPIFPRGVSLSAGSPVLQ